jgi:enamine deaminase RidA (YjgF/YER057c/UK114 family)
MSPRTPSVFAEQRVQDLEITLPTPPTPLGADVETLQTGNLLFLSGTLPIEAGVPRFRGRIGDNLSVEDGRQAARLATLNSLALAKAHLQSLNRIKQIVRLGVSMVTTAQFQEHPKVRRCSIRIARQRVRARNSTDPPGAGHGLLALGLVRRG